MARAMRRLLALALILSLSQCLGGSTPGAPTPIRGQRIVIASVPVQLDAADPQRTRLGKMTFLGGWALSSDSRAFGGLSALDVHEPRVTALSDVGAVVRFRFGRFGNVSDARLDPVPRGCGSVTKKVDNDAESLTHDPTRGHWWIGIEWRNSICRTNGDFSAGRGAAPGAMAGWPRKRGPESLVRLNDGRFLTIAEKAPDGAARHPALLFDRDPIDPKAKLARLSYVPPEGFNPVDATQLPDGRILVLNRRFTLTSLFTAVLVIVDAPTLAGGQVLQGRELARFEAPVVTDNFEGVSATVEQGRTIVWIVSDDNYMRWQRTLLLKFALD